MTKQWVARDTWAKFFIDKMMSRKNEAGYTDDAAIAEGFRLADLALKVRDQRGKRKDKED
jgi:hypothetical protein